MCGAVRKVVERIKEGLLVEIGYRRIGRRVAFHSFSVYNIYTEHDQWCDQGL